MKRVKRQICKILVILLCISFIPKQSYAICNTFNFSKEVSAVQLTLANGVVLHDIRVDKNIKAQRPIFGDVYKTLNLVFIIEAESNIYKNKAKLISFIEKLYDLYGDNADKIKIGILSFDGSLMEKEFDDNFDRDIYKNSKEEVIEQINNLETFNTRKTLESALRTVIEAGGLYQNLNRN